MAFHRISITSSLLRLARVDAGEAAGRPSSLQTNYELRNFSWSFDYDCSNLCLRIFQLISAHRQGELRKMHTGKCIHIGYS